MRHKIIMLPTHIIAPEISELHKHIVVYINFNIHSKAHIMRASQEGIVFALNYGLQRMKDMGIQSPEVDGILLEVVEAMEERGYEVNIVKLTPWANIHFKVDEQFRRDVYTLQVLIEKPNLIHVQISDLWDKKKDYKYVSIEKFEKGIIEHRGKSIDDLDLEKEIEDELIDIIAYKFFKTK